VCFPGERPAANGHLLRSGHHPRRRPDPAAAPGHIATSTGAWPEGVCSCWLRPGRRRQRHAGLARSLSRSSVVLDVSMAGSCWRIQGQARSRDGRRVLIGMPGAARASAGRASAEPVPHASLGLRIQGEPGIRHAGERSYRSRRITGQQPEGSRRLASRPVSPGGSASRLAARPRRFTTRGADGALPEPYGGQIRGLALVCSSRW